MKTLIQCSLSLSFFLLLLSANLIGGEAVEAPRLRFRENGQFKILQVADMHYANGITTSCLNVSENQFSTCSDLNTTAFLYRMIREENPDLIVFTGDNIFGSDATDAEKSLNAAFAPAITSKIAWAAVLGNHDQESTLSREGLMRHIVSMQYTVSQVNPAETKDIDGFGNYNVEVGGVAGSMVANKSVLNLYFVDSGDYSSNQSISTYDWIKPSQQKWFQETSLKLKSAGSSPGLAYFHIPLPEYKNFDTTNFTGVKGEDAISSPSVNSGFFSTMVKSGDVKAVFTGHDHLNDFCGKLTGINLCYGGGFGYHAYGKAGWDRRARVVLATLEKTGENNWGAVKAITTWKRLDDEFITAIDPQILWTKS